jgi:ABC-type thiamine transport system substrate-binding protein
VCVQVTPTWSAAYNVFEAGNSSLIVSFGTDPAYNTCNGYADSIRTLVHHSASGQPWAWAMVEGMAVVNTTRNVSAAEDFVSFWFSLDLQSNLWDGNYMVPTLLQAETQTEPLCYQQSPVTLPKDVNLFNAPFFANGTVQANFARWKSTWASLYNTSRGKGPATGAAAHVTAQVGTVLAAVMMVAMVLLVV